MEASRAATKESAASVLSTLPGLVALVLGGTYIAGAMAYRGSLTDAEVSVADTLPLIPLEQVLERGMSVLTAPAALYGVLIYVSTAFDSKTDEARRPRIANRTRLLIFLGVGVLIVLFVSWGWGLATLVATGVGTVVWLFVYDSPGWFTGTSIRRGMGYLIVVGAFLSAQGVGSALLTPRPLPDAEIVTHAQGVVRGGLVVHRDGSWYVATGRKHVTVLAEDAVKKVKLTSGEQNNNDPLLTLIF